MCAPIPGTFSCVCNPGYALDEDGFSCSDVNECLNNNGGCEQICAISAGGFSCSCNAGYRLNEDGLTCDPNDACEDEPCENDGECVEEEVLIDVNAWMVTMVFIAKIISTIVIRILVKTMGPVLMA